MRRNFLKISVAAMIVVVISVFVSHGEVFATTVKGVISDKALYQGVYKCYTNGHVKNRIDSLSEYSGSAEPLKYIVNGTDKSDENFIPLVTGWKGRGYDVKDSGVSCSQLLNGGQFGIGGYAGNILKAFNQSIPQIKNTDDVVSLTENMGYKVSSNNDICYSLNYSFSGNTNTYRTNQVCQSSDSTLYAEDAGDSSTKFTASNKKVCLHLKAYFGSQEKGCTDLGNNKFSGEWLMSTINTICGSLKCENSYSTDGPGGGRRTVTETIEFDSSVEGGSNLGNSLKNSTAIFKDGSSSIAAMTANSFLSKGNIDAGKTADILVSALEKRVLYQAYLTTYYNVEINCETGLSDSAFDGKFNWLDSDGKVKECHYETNKATNTDKEVNGVDGSGYFVYQSLSFNGLISAIDNLPTTYSDDEIQELLSKSDKNDDENKKVDCLTSGAAENLGWIICPILSFAHDVSQQMYDEFIEPALQIDPNLFKKYDGNSNDDTYDAWSIFQGFANILFVIFFLFVIFSQLTGIGIDNYGIKKIMPKLIVTAILINLSYLICLICVDLSNIVGNGVTEFFNNLSPEVSVSIGDIDVGESIGSTMLTGIALFGAGYLAYVTAAMWILPLLVAAVGLLVSVIFLFILLAGREAALVVLTVISPLAFVCYMLPNTKNLFSKYIKVGEVLLLLYPICGLMVAGGGYVSKLLLAVGVGKDDYFGAFTAMIISIVPIFFIPKLVKNSFNALGSLGASISGFGDRMRGRATSGIRGSGAYKAGQERLREGQTRWRAGVGENMNFRQRLARGVFTRRGVARNRAQYNKDQSARNTEALLLDPNYMENMEAHREASLSNEREKMYAEVFDREPDRNRIETELNAALRGSDPERASAALNALINKGGVSEAFNALRSITNWNAMDSNVRTRVVQAMGNSGIDAMKAYATYRNTGGLASFDNWSRGTVSASDSSASTKNKTYAQYLRQQKEHAIDNYGKDEMQFVRSLSGDLHTQMGADYGRMVGSAMINSKDARAQTEVDDMIYDDISSGSLNAKDLGRSANELSTIRQDAIQKVMQGYRASGRGFAGIRSDLGTQINMIQTTPQLRGKLNNVAKKIFGIT